MLSLYQYFKLKITLKKNPWVLKFISFIMLFMLIFVFINLLFNETLSIVSLLPIPLYILYQMFRQTEMEIELKNSTEELKFYKEKANKKI